jgi:hypothetical protein
MKIFNFRKLGILLVLMLVSGIVIVGSVSAAWSETHDTQTKGNLMYGPVEAC